MGSSPSGAAGARRETAVVASLVGAIAIVATAGALVVYKASGALALIASVRRGGAVVAKQEWVPTAEMPALVQPLAGALNYFLWMGIALAFGILIGATVKALVPSRWIVRTLGTGGLRGQLLAAATGVPLMLCSCCAAPVFEGVYGRTRRLGPSLGLMLAAPGLNPAAIALTFLLFPARLAAGRLAVALVLTLFAAAVLGRAFTAAPQVAACAVDLESPGWRSLARSFAGALRDVSIRSLPAIGLGVLASVVLLDAMPVQFWTATPGGSAAIIMVVGALGVLIALPTFAEIPIGLSLLAAGVPEGAVLALLIAGPIVNLPSLFTVGKVVSWRAAAATAASVFVASTGAGLLLGG